MEWFKYIWAKLFKKIRGKAVLNCQIHKTSKIEAGSEVINVRMAMHSFCGYNCEINYCDIGSYVSIANGVIIGGGMHPLDWVGMSPVFYKGRDSVKAKFSQFEREPVKRTIIGNDVWIGQNVLIKQGVNIGTGSVIGMGSVVTKDVDPYTIVAGNPARVIRKRFEQNIIERLLLSKWWELPETELKKRADFIRDPIEFLNSIEK